MGSGDFAILDERFRPLVKVTARLEKLYEGCRWAEGPAYFPAQRSLVWSDIPNDRMLRYDETDGRRRRLPRSRPATRTATRSTAQGRLVTCEHGNRRVTRTEHDGTITVLAERFEGKRLNSPNDVVVQIRRLDLVHRSGLRHRLRLRGPQGRERDRRLPRLPRRSRDRRRSRIVADDFVRPNGLAFSPDERLLYVADTGVTHMKDGPTHIRVFDVARRRQAVRRRGLRRLHQRPSSTASGSTPRAASGRAPATACIATTRTAR